MPCNELRFADGRQCLEVEPLELREREQSDDQNQEAQNCQRYERALYYSIHDFHGTTSEGASKEPGPWDQAGLRCDVPVDRGIIAGTRLQSPNTRLVPSEPARLPNRVERRLMHGAPPPGTHWGDADGGGPAGRPAADGPDESTGSNPDRS